MGGIPLGNCRTGVDAIDLVDAALSPSIRSTLARRALDGSWFLDMPVPSLPTELTDEIIAWVSVVCDSEKEKRSNLLSCCLVCSAWLPASRSQLFQELTIDTLERYDLLVSRVLNSDKMRGYLACVTHVYFSLKVTEELAAISERRAFILQFAGHLPNVTFMGLSAIGIFMSHPSSFVAISQFSSIKQLGMGNCNFPSFGAIRRTLTSLPSLTELLLISPSWPPTATDLSPRLSHGASAVPRPALSILRIVSWDNSARGRRCAQQFMAWLSETATAFSLVQMVTGGNVGLERAGFLGIFSPFLFSFGRRVRALDIEVHEDDYDADCEHFLSQFSSLETLQLRLRYNPGPDAWVRMERLLHSISRPMGIVELSIEVLCYPEGISELSIVDGLVTLDTALQLEQFDALKAVRFDIRFRPEGSDLMEKARRLSQALNIDFTLITPNLAARSIVVDPRVRY